MSVLVLPLLIAHTRGHYRLARRISFLLLGVVTVSVVLRVFFLVTTLSGRGDSALSVLVDAVVIWISTVVTFAVWHWEIDGGGPAERTMDVYASEDFLFQGCYQLVAGLPRVPVPSLQHERSFQPHRHARALSKSQDPDGGPVCSLVGGPLRARRLGRKRPLERLSFSRRSR